MPIIINLNYNKNAQPFNTSGVIWVSSDAITTAESQTLTERAISLTGVAAEHYWNAEIGSFSSPSYKIDTEHGGFIDMTFGSLTLSPDAFETNWPPPRHCTILVRYIPSDTTEIDPVLIFQGDISLVRYDEESALYDLNAPQYPQNLLTLGPDYNGDTVPYPEAFGIVTNMEALRVPDKVVGIYEYPTYYLSGLGTASTGRTISCFSSAATGAKTTIVLIGANPWSDGESVIVLGTNNFDGTHVIESATATSFDIPVAFPTDNSESLPIHGSAFTPGDFLVCEGGVPIMERVTVNGDGTFSLDKTTVDIVTITGTSAYATLSDVMQWAQARLGIGSFVDTYARVVSPEVSYWADSQKTLIDFMSDICAFFTHYFYIRSDRLVFGDMLIDADTDTFDEFNYFSAQYSAMDPIKQIKSSWSTYESYEGFVDEVSSSQTIREIKNNVVESAYKVSEGTTDDVGAFKLIDTAATFITDGIKTGYIAKNATDDKSSIVFKVMSETTLELVDDIFATAEDYIIGPSLSYGQEISITPYHDTKSNVSAALQNILGVRNMDVIEIAIPIADLPMPGKKITFSDNQMLTSVSSWFRVRNITYNFESEEIVLSGEGVIT